MHIRRYHRSSSMMAGLIAAGLIPVLCGTAPAQSVIGASWTGGANGSWFSTNGMGQAINWSTINVPNNGTPSNTEYAVSITGPSGVTVTAESSATVDSLNFSVPNGVLSITGNIGFTNNNAGGVFIAATDSIQISGSGTLLVYGNLPVSGGGNITLGGSNTNIGGGFQHLTLTNASTIQGTGNIGVNGDSLILANQSGGLINANVSGQTLTVALATGSTNAGTLQASNGGILALEGTLINSGTITALAGSTVGLNGNQFGAVTVTAAAGGQLSTAGNGMILGTSVTLDGTSSPMVNAGNFQVVNTAVQGTLTNNGAITFAANGNLSVVANTTLNGTGTVTMAAGTNISGGVQHLTLTNASTIQGVGGIGTAGDSLILANQSAGLINANVSGQTLTVALATGSTNAGTLQASNGGALALEGTLINSGTITALAGSTVGLNGNQFGALTVTAAAGGQLSTAGNGMILGTSVTLDGTGSPMVNAGNFQVVNTAVQGTMTNNGAITFGTNDTLSVVGNTTLNGTGTVTMAAGTNISAGVQHLTLTNAATIQGAGGIGTVGDSLILANQAGGLINANVSGGTLTVNAATGSTNAGTLEASNGGTLLLEGTLANTGTILSQTGSTMSLSGTALSNLPGGVINVAGLVGSGTLSIAAGSTTTTSPTTTGASYSGTISGAGALTVNGLGTQTLTATNSYTGGTNVLSGTLSVASDANLGTGNVTGGTPGTVAFTGTTSTTKSFAMNGGKITVAAGQTVTFNGGPVSGATLDGAGTFATNATNGAQFVNVTTEPSVVITSNSAKDQFEHFTNSAALTVAAGVNTSGASTTVNLNGFTNEGVGTITIGAGSQVNVANFQSYGMMTVNPATGSQETLVTDRGNSALGFNAGSQTFLGTPATAPGMNGPYLDGLDLHGHNMLLTGGLFVNNGFTADSQSMSTSIIVGYGALFKGAGTNFVPIVTQNGGKFQAGNSPGVADFGSLVLGAGGVNNYVFAIDDATGTAGPGPDALGHVSGWGLIKAVQANLPLAGGGAISRQFHLDRDAGRSTDGSPRHAGRPDDRRHGYRRPDGQFRSDTVVLVAGRAMDRNLFRPDRHGDAECRDGVQHQRVCECIQRHVWLVPRRDGSNAVADLHADPCAGAGDAGVDGAVGAGRRLGGSLATAAGCDLAGAVKPPTVSVIC
jgi:fibronectin-binding autotransporter adhesin